MSKSNDFDLLYSGEKPNENFKRYAFENHFLVYRIILTKIIFSCQ